MPQTQDIATNTLVVTRTVRAPIERVFRAWTTAEELTHWFSPARDATIVASVDLRVGGNYRIEMHHKDGTVFTVFGEYKEIQAPEKLVYSWQWENDARGIDSLVELSLRSVGDGTEITIQHHRLPTEEARQKHAHGWNGCLERLATYF